MAGSGASADRVSRVSTIADLAADDRGAERLDLEQAKTLFRDAMAHLGAAVNIVTTDGPGGRAGFSATAICSVTDSPPTLLVCLNRAASAYPILTTNQVFCVNTLGSAHQELAQLFGGKTPQDDRFANASWSTVSTGSQYWKMP